MDEQRDPAGMLAKHVEFLSVELMMEGKPDSGRPVVTLWLAYGGDPEPQLLSLSDTRRLAEGLIEVLAGHGDITAMRLYRECQTTGGWPDPDDDHDSSGTDVVNPEQAKPTHPTIFAQEAPINIRVRMPGQRRVQQHSVLGGYTDGRQIRFLVRQIEEDGVVADRVVILGDKPPTIGCAPPEESLVPDRWSWFVELPADAPVKIGMRVWRKIMPCQIRDMIRSVTYGVIG